MKNNTQSMNVHQLCVKILKNPTKSNGVLNNLYQIWYVFAFCGSLEKNFQTSVFQFSDLEQCCKLPKKKKINKKKLHIRIIYSIFRALLNLV